MWKPVRVFNKDAVPMVLTFDALSAAQAYVGRNQPDTVRIVWTTDDGEREVVEAGEGGVRGATRHCAGKNPAPK